ncbi:MAG: cytoplasmic protein [Calditrichaeota bacterium]|nr:MAG: cytoplasmic protein [Calditrichota bacterium]
MPFGKYKDRYIYQLPSHYLEWFSRNGFPNGRLGMLLSTMHEIKQNGLDELLVPLIKKLHKH